jgi:hypothetical protein
VKLKLTVTDSAIIVAFGDLAPAPREAAIAALRTDNRTADEAAMT